MCNANGAGQDQSDAEAMRMMRSTMGETRNAMRTMQKGMGAM